MKIGEVDANALYAWINDVVDAIDGVPRTMRQEVELHVLAQCYELRCGENDPLRVEPARA